MTGGAKRGKNKEGERQALRRNGAEALQGPRAGRGAGREGQRGAPAQAGQQHGARGASLLGQRAEAVRVAGAPAAGEEAEGGAGQASQLHRGQDGEVFQPAS